MVKVRLPPAGADGTVLPCPGIDVIGHYRGNVGLLHGEGQGHRRLGGIAAVRPGYRQCLIVCSRPETRVGLDDEGGGGACGQRNAAAAPPFAASGNRIVPAGGQGHRQLLVARVGNGHSLGRGLGVSGVHGAEVQSCWVNRDGVGGQYPEMGPVLQGVILPVCMGGHFFTIFSGDS